MSRQTFPYGIKWKINSVKGGGDCLFDSVSVALKSIKYEYDVDDLRHAVAKRVLNPNDKEMEEIVRNWIRLYQESSGIKKIQKNFLNENMSEEYIHVASVAAHKPPPPLLAKNQSTFPITIQDRTIIYKNMMLSSFWGEEICLQTFQQLLYCRFLIFSLNRDRTSRSFGNPIAMQPVGEVKYETYIILFLKNNHYTPMSYNECFIFTPSTLPLDAKKFFFQFL